jgi:arginine decarboxylase
MKNTLVLPGNRAKASRRPGLVSEGILLGNRIPKDFFITTGTGESDITVHAGSYHLALRDAGIEMCNIMTYSSILPAIANEVPKPETLRHGAVLETIMATATALAGDRASAGIIWGWLQNKQTGERHGGLVCEYNGCLEEREVEQQLRASIEELYTNGYSDDFGLEDTRLIMRSFVPGKRFGTALVGLCFLNCLWPVLHGKDASAYLCS